MALTNGKLYLKDGVWRLDETPPHIAIKLKAIFPHIPKSAVNPFKFPHTPEACNDLAWFTDRYVMEISDSDKAKLKASKKKHDKLQDEMGRLLMPDYKPTAQQFKEGKKERDYQAIGRELCLKMKRMVCGDDLGLGKTVLALGVFMEPKTLPALVVVQTHLPKQWNDFINQYTNLTVHRIEGTKPYNLPAADVYIMKYSCLSGWSNFLDTGFFKCVVFDEVQELRTGPVSQKYCAAQVASNKAEYVLGLTATLIYNYGIEAFNIFNLIKPDCLGDQYDFEREWSGFGKKIKDPAALGSYLRSQFLFLRRTRAEVKRELPPVNKIIQEVEVDHADVQRIEELAISLSMKVVSGTFYEAGEAARELDIMMRRNTGLAKARPVAQYVKLFLENNEPVILVGWHRDVYDIWLEELKEYNPVMFTGSETGAQKEAAKAKFLAGETNLLIMSLRSGPGTDGLQKRCKTMAIGELDWSPGVHNQLIGRIDRDGQEGDVMVMFFVCNEGSDPTMMDILGLKSSQAAFINDPSLGIQQQYSDESRIKQLAMSFLERRGIKVPEPLPAD